MFYKASEITTIAFSATNLAESVQTINIGSVTSSDDPDPIDPDVTAGKAAKWFRDNSNKGDKFPAFTVKEPAFGVEPEKAAPKSGLRPGWFVSILTDFRNFD